MSKDESKSTAVAYYEISQGHSAKAAAGNKCIELKANVDHHSTVTWWYQRFRSDDTPFDEEPRSHRKSTFDFV